MLRLKSSVAWAAAFATGSLRQAPAGRSDMPHVNQLDCCQNCCQDHGQLPDARRQAWNVGPEDSRCSTVPDDLPMTTDQKVLIAGERCERAARAQVQGWPLNRDVLPLNIKGASRFLRKWPAATLDIEPPEALWPATKGQAASLARVRGHPLHAAGGHRAKSSGGWA